VPESANPGHSPASTVRIVRYAHADGDARL
jgi:hypothetical protein